MKKYLLYLAFVGLLFSTSNQAQEPDKNEKIAYQESHKHISDAYGFFGMLSCVAFSVAAYNELNNNDRSFGNILLMSFFAYSAQAAANLSAIHYKKSIE